MEEFTSINRPVFSLLQLVNPHDYETQTSMEILAMTETGQTVQKLLYSFQSPHLMLDICHFKGWRLFF